MEVGQKGSPFSQRGPHSPGKMETPGPHFHGGPQNFMTPGETVLYRGSHGQTVRVGRSDTRNEKPGLEADQLYSRVYGDYSESNYPSVNFYLISKLNGL